MSIGTDSNKHSLTSRLPTYHISRRKRLLFNKNSTVVCKECTISLEYKYFLSNKGSARCLQCALDHNLIAGIPAIVQRKQQEIEVLV